MQGHQQKGRQTNTSSNNKDKYNTIIETSTTGDHDENLHNPSTRPPRYSPGSRRRAVVVSHFQRITRWPITLARGLLNREKRKKGKSLAARPPHPPPPPQARCSFGENKNKNKSRDASSCLGATQVGVTQVVSVRHASVQGFLRLVSWANGCRFAKFYASVCDCNFPSLVASLFSWQCLAASSFSSLHARKCVPNNVPGLSLSPFFSLSKHSPRHTVSY